MRSQRAIFDLVFPNGLIYAPALKEFIRSKESDKLNIQSAFWKCSFFKGDERNLLRPEEAINFLKEKRREYAQKKIAGPGPHDGYEITRVKRDVNGLWKNQEFFAPRDGHENENHKVIVNLLCLYDGTYKQEYAEIAGLTYYLLKQEMICSERQESLYSVMFTNDQEGIEADTFWLMNEIIEFSHKVNSEDCRTSLDGTVNCLLEMKKDLGEKVRTMVNGHGEIYNRMSDWFLSFYAHEIAFENIMFFWTKIFSYCPNYGILHDIGAFRLKSLEHVILSGEATRLSKIQPLDYNEASELIGSAMNRRKEIQTGNSWRNDLIFVMQVSRQIQDKEKLKKELSYIRDALMTYSATCLDHQDFQEGSFADAVEEEEEEEEEESA